MSKKMSTDIFTVLCDEQSHDEAYGEHCDSNGVVESLKINWDPDRMEWELISTVRQANGTHHSQTDWISMPSEDWLCNQSQPVLMDMCKRLEA